MKSSSFTFVKLGAYLPPMFAKYLFELAFCSFFFVFWRLFIPYDDLELKREIFIFVFYAGILSAFEGSIVTGYLPFLAACSVLYSLLAGQDFFKRLNFLAFLSVLSVAYGTVYTLAIAGVDEVTLPLALGLGLANIIVFAGFVKKPVIMPEAQITRNNRPSRLKADLRLIFGKYVFELFFCAFSFLLWSTFGFFDDQSSRSFLDLFNVGFLMTFFSTFPYYLLLLFTCSVLYRRFERKGFLKRLDFLAFLSLLSVVYVLLYLLGLFGFGEVMPPIAFGLLLANVFVFVFGLRRPRNIIASS